MSLSAIMSNISKKKLFDQWSDIFEITFFFKSNLPLHTIKITHNVCVLRYLTQRFNSSSLTYKLNNTKKIRINLLNNRVFLCGPSISSTFMAQYNI